MEITYQEYQKACQIVKNYYEQEKQKFEALENELLITNGNYEDIKNGYSGRLYYQILVYFDKVSDYHRNERNIKIADLNNISKSVFASQKSCGKKVLEELEDLCKKFNFTLRD
jgi:CRISPR/Cas system-associated endonuclease Cas3-HD